ncbi:MAG: hypothetical protein FWC39_07295 [Bacteroidetes bacterium]|nr:hypothetical protein [Bacteroidota bacterium]
MNEYSSQILENLAKAPLSAQQQTPYGEVWYFGFPKNQDGTRCRIERIIKSVYSQTATTIFVTEWVGLGFYEFDWNLRETYNYTQKTV